MAVNVDPGYYDFDKRSVVAITQQIVVPLTPVLLLPYNVSRLRMAITNIGANAIWIGGDATVTIGTGYRIAAAGTFNVNTVCEVWAVAAVGPSLTCMFLEMLRQRPKLDPY